MPVSVENSSPLKGILFDTSDNENNFTNLGTADVHERSKKTSICYQKESSQFFGNAQLNGTPKFSSRSDVELETASISLGNQVVESPVQFLACENLRNLQDPTSYLSSFSSLPSYTTPGNQWDQFASAPTLSTHTVPCSQNPCAQPFNSIESLSHRFTQNEPPDAASSYVSLDALMQTDINHIKEASDSAIVTSLEENCGLISKSDIKTESNEGLVAWSTKSAHLSQTDSREAESQGSFTLPLPWNSTELPSALLSENCTLTQGVNAVSDRPWSSIPKNQNLQQQPNDVRGLSIADWHTSDFLEKSEQVRTFKIEDDIHVPASHLESDSYNSRPSDTFDPSVFVSYPNQHHSQSSLTCTSFQPEMPTFALSSSSSDINEHDNLIHVSKHHDVFQPIYCKTEDEFSSSVLNPSGSDILPQSNDLREPPGGPTQRSTTSTHFTNPSTIEMTPAFYETYQHNQLPMPYLDVGQQYQLAATPREVDEAYQNQTDFQCAGVNYTAGSTAAVAYDVAVNGAFTDGVQYLGSENMLTPVPRSAATSACLEGSRFSLRETLLGTPLTASTPDNCSAEAMTHLDGPVSRGPDETASVSSGISNCSAAGATGTIYFWQYNAQCKGPKAVRLINECRTTGSPLSASALSPSSTCYDALSSASILTPIGLGGGGGSFSPVGSCSVAANSMPQYPLVVFEDPVQKRNDLVHCSKLRRGDGNDVTPNILRLRSMGDELDRLSTQITHQGEIIMAGGLIGSTPDVLADSVGAGKNPAGGQDPRTFDMSLSQMTHPDSLERIQAWRVEEAKREKNKLASKICRLKKKAFHESNKIKYTGLGLEYRELANLIISLKELLSQRVSPSLARLLQHTSTSPGDFSATHQHGRPPVENEKTVTGTNDLLKGPGTLYNHAKWLQSAIHVTRVAGRMDSFVEEVLSLAKATQAKHPLIKRLSGGCNNGRELSTKLSAAGGDLDLYAREGQIPSWNLVPCTPVHQSDVTYHNGTAVGQAPPFYGTPQYDGANVFNACGKQGGGTMNMAHRPPSALDLSLMRLPGLTDDASRLSDFPYSSLIRPLQQPTEEWLEYPQQYPPISTSHAEEQYESCMTAVPDYFSNPYSCDMIYQPQPTLPIAPDVFCELAPTLSSPTPAPTPSISAASRVTNELLTVPKKFDSRSESEVMKDRGNSFSPLFYVPQPGYKMPYLGNSMTASKLTQLTDYVVTAAELSPSQTTPPTTASLEPGNGSGCQPCLQVIT